MAVGGPAEERYEELQRVRAAQGMAVQANNLALEAQGRLNMLACAGEDVEGQRLLEGARAEVGRLVTHLRLRALMMRDNASLAECRLIEAIRDQQIALEGLKAVAEAAGEDGR